MKLHLFSIVAAVVMSALPAGGQAVKVDEVQVVAPARRSLDFSGVPVLGDARIVYADPGRYEAFTDIIKFKGKYYISFRDGYSHIWDADGTAQGHTKIIMSSDGVDWIPVLDQKEAGIDLRDPKMSITPDGRLMVLAGGSEYGNRNETSKCFGRMPRVSFSEDGLNFTDPVPVQLENATWNDWLWRVTWRGKVGFGFSKGEQYVLYKTKNGIKYKTVKELNSFSNGALGNETTVRFLKDGTMLMLARTRDTSKPWAVGDGLWGISRPPYKKWVFKEVPMGLGGPNFVVVDDRYCIVATRWMAEDMHRTVLLKSDLEGNMTPVCILPSGGGVGNCSYPGLLIEGDELWVSYYSQHETEKSVIYFVKYPLSMFE